MTLRTCRHCRQPVALTHHGYLSHHVPVLLTCPGSQSDDWEREPAEQKTPEPDPLALGFEGEAPA